MPVGKACIKPEPREQALVLDPHANCLADARTSRWLAEQAGRHKGRIAGREFVTNAGAKMATAPAIPTLPPYVLTMGDVEASLSLLIPHRPLYFTGTHRTHLYRSHAR